jgi:hypothetical protein
VIFEGKLAMWCYVLFSDLTYNASSNTTSTNHSITKGDIKEKNNWFVNQRIDCQYRLTWYVVKLHYMDYNLQRIVVIMKLFSTSLFLICYISCVVSNISVIRVFKFLRLVPRGKRMKECIHSFNIYIWLTCIWYTNLEIILKKNKI